MNLKHKKPCSECPWRRKSLNGWLGGYPLDDFINNIQFDGAPLPCHKTSHFAKDPLDEDDLDFCAGALIFMKNSCKYPHHPEYGDVLEKIEKDTDNVFHWPQEFRDHHSKDFVLGED